MKTIRTERQQPCRFVDLQPAARAEIPARYSYADQIPIDMATRLRVSFGAVGDHEGQDAFRHVQRER